MTDDLRQPETEQPPADEPKKKRASDAEIEQRVTKVVELMASGLKRAQIIKYVQDKTDWKVETRQLDTYIQKATEHFKELAAVDRTTEFGKAKARMEMILAMALKMQDFQRAIAAAKEIHTLTGIYPASKSELKIEGIELLTQLNELATASGKDLSNILKSLITHMGGKPNGS